MYRLEHPDDEKAQAEAGHIVVGEENRTGFKAIGVPGDLKAWLSALHNHGSGKLSLRQIMAPAIDYAENGVRLSPAASRFIALSEERCERFAGWMSEFLPDGEAPEAGSLLRRPAYAVTLKALADAAPEDASLDEQLEAAGVRFYRDDIANNIVGYVRDNGGVLSMDDMAWYYGDGLDDLSDQQGLRLRTPVRGTYRGCEIIAMPPTSSGGTHIIEILNILEGFDLGP